ncbi:MAG: hypothetical protein PVI00_04560 [Desulfobacterales bacterium]
MLKKTLTIIHISRWLIAVFVICVAGVAAIPFEKDNRTTRIAKGTIISHNIRSITMGSQKHPGHILTLSTNPKGERPALRSGDQVIVEYSQDYIIQAIIKRGLPSSRSAGAAPRAYLLGQNHTNRPQKRYAF